MVQQLADDVPEADFDEAKLATLICELMQFQEDTLGKDVSGCASTWMPGI